ncbi:MAG: HPr family phosphocarrier protein [Clostridium sp.]|nr:HPr family phosphocarrier protein [Clostridium sp.]
MKHVMVKFDKAEQIINFVKIINRYDYDADVRCGSRIVDAKSVVGVLSLAKSKTVELILHTEECGALLEEIAPFAA